MGGAERVAGVVQRGRERETSERARERDVATGVGAYVFQRFVCLEGGRRREHGKRRRRCLFEKPWWTPNHFGEPSLEKFCCCCDYCGGQGRHRRHQDEPEVRREQVQGKGLVGRVREQVGG